MKGYPHPAFQRKIWYCFQPAFDAFGGGMSIYILLIIISEFRHTITEGGFTHTTDARNVLSFGVDINFSVPATNRVNNIYVMGTSLTQCINDTTLYAEKNFYRNFTDFGKKFVLSLHYHGDNSYLFVNGNQELKFKAKTDQLVKEKLCIGNLSDQWTTSESEKTGTYGRIYNFVVDYNKFQVLKLFMICIGI